MAIRIQTGHIFLLLVLALAAPYNFASQDILLAKDGKNEDFFAYSVAIDGDTALVGAFKADIGNVSNAGAAYVYVLNKNGWMQQAKLIAEPHFSEDTLGGKVALNNNIAMLGVMQRDDMGKDSGAVVSFERTATEWKQSEILTAPDAKPGDAFGQSIALTKDFLVIGAPRSDILGKDSGAAYVFKRQNNRWQYQSKINADDGVAGDLFGISVAIDGNTVIVGADLHDEKAENAGAAYVFKLQEDKWVQQAKLMASDGGNTDIFGVRVSISGNTALISARRDDIQGMGVDAGSAYLFERKGNNWQQMAKLVSPDGNADDRFGRGVAINGNTAIISAMNNDENGTDAGAVYVYKKEAGRWQYSSKVIANKSMPSYRFGWNVALSDSHIIVASPYHDANGKESGAAFIHTLNGDN
ncbi:MAG: hypothetical protein AAGB12_13325 [Pseudomonadota bacterium]